MMAPKRIGDVTQSYFLARCLEVGWAVSVPLGDCSRYDCILDRKNGLERIQIKTGRIRNGAITFSSCSSTYHVPGGCNTKHKHQPYYGEIDNFGIYCPETRKCYIVPVDCVGRREGSLRVELSKNGQHRGVKFAKDYEIVGESIYQPVKKKVDKSSL